MVIDMRAVFDETLVTGNDTLDYLSDYTEFHIGEEEKLQEKVAERTDEMGGIIRFCLFCLSGGDRMIAEGNCEGTI